MNSASPAQNKLQEAQAYLGLSVVKLKVALQITYGQGREDGSLVGPRELVKAHQMMREALTAIAYFSDHPSENQEELPF